MECVYSRYYSRIVVSKCGVQLSSYLCEQNKMFCPHPVLTRRNDQWWRALHFLKVLQIQVSFRFTKEPEFLLTGIDVSTVYVC